MRKVDVLVYQQPDFDFASELGEPIPTTTQLLSDGDKCSTLRSYWTIEMVEELNQKGSIIL